MVVLQTLVHLQGQLWLCWTAIQPKTSYHHLVEEVVPGSARCDGRPSDNASLVVLVVIELQVILPPLTNRCSRTSIWTHHQYGWIAGWRWNGLCIDIARGGNRYMWTVVLVSGPTGDSLEVIQDKE